MEPKWRFFYKWLPNDYIYTWVIVSNNPPEPYPAWLAGYSSVAMVPNETNESIRREVNRVRDSIRAE